MCSRQDRTTELILFRASLLIAGTKPVVMRPLLVRALRPRNPYPRNVNDVCSCEPRRLASWQYKIRVLSGCSASPTSLIRSWSGQHLAGLALGGAVDHRVVHVALESDARERP